MVTEIEASVTLEAAIQVPSRFDYVKYDDHSQGKQSELKLAAQKVEAAIEALDDELGAYDKLIVDAFNQPKGVGSMRLPINACLARERLIGIMDTDKALIALEESYMWCGKTIRDEQIDRNGSAQLQESRGTDATTA